MRLKNILFTIAATTWLFSSCSEETLIDGPVISGGEEATISATLSINSVETKATTNYETPVSDNEELINNYVIAVFDAARQDVVGLKAETFQKRARPSPKPSTSFSMDCAPASTSRKAAIWRRIFMPSTTTWRAACFTPTCTTIRQPSTKFWVC